MNIEQVLAALTPEIVASFRTAIEIGKWPNGQPLTKQQLEICMQAVVAWEHQHLPEEQRTGYIDRTKKEEAEACESHEHDPNEIKPIRFI